MSLPLKPALSTLFAAALAAGATAFAAVAAPATAPAPAAEAAPIVALPDLKIADKPLPAHRAELLDLAFEAATAMPVNPHIKTRSREQEAVVEACLKLDQPQRALRFTRRIDNWRRGAAYADLAAYAARHGDAVVVQPYLKMAVEISKLADQDWRRDRVLSKVAQAQVWSGDRVTAERSDETLDATQRGRVAVALASRADEAEFDRQMQALERLVAIGGFETTQAALDAYAELFNRFYSHELRRDQIETALKASWKQIPLIIRIDVLLKLAGYAIDHEDKTKALALVNETRDVIKSVNWPLDAFVPVMARLAATRHRAGDVEAARKEADRALEVYDRDHKLLQDFERGAAIRPLAEAYQSMGDAPQALRVYQRAIDAGALNPNARPRAEDLSATCRSMAVAGVEPDPTQWAQLRLLLTGLRDPW